MRYINLRFSYLLTYDRQTTDGRAIAYSEREREFTFANKTLKHSKILQNNFISFHYFMMEPRLK